MKFLLEKKQVQFVGAVEQFPAYIGGIGTGKTTRRERYRTLTDAEYDRIVLHEKKGRRGFLG